jgi:hypothetical protein
MVNFELFAVKKAVFACSVTYPGEGSFHSFGRGIIPYTPIQMPVVF